MKKPRSYVIFTDGHEEDILYYEQHKDRTLDAVVFATKSGVYHYEESLSQTETMFRHILPHFERVTATEKIKIDTIKAVHIDERLPFEYRLTDSDGSCVTGYILVPPKATDAEIRKLIMQDLEIEYEMVRK